MNTKLSVILKTNDETFNIAHIYHEIDPNDINEYINNFKQGLEQANEVIYALYKQISNEIEAGESNFEALFKSLIATILIYSNPFIGIIIECYNIAMSNEKRIHSIILQYDSVVIPLRLKIIDSFKIIYN